jgi:L-threonylcarbamoyladenylate synthase
LESTVVTALRSDKGKGKQRESNGDVPEEELRVLRLGGISPEQLQLALDEAGLSKQVSLRVEAHEGTSSHVSTGGVSHKPDFIPSTPGMKYKHYSPNAKVVLLRLVEKQPARQLSEVLQPYTSANIGLIHVRDSPLLSMLDANMPLAHKVCFGDADDHQAQAQGLFGALRALDEAKVDVIFVESVKEEGLGRTVMERLRKSAGGRDVIDVCMSVDSKP